MGQAMVVLQPAQHGEKIVPVVPVRFFSRDPTQQHEIHGPRIMDVGRNVHEVLRRPPQANRGAEWIASLHQERAETDDRHQELSQTPSEKHHESAERNKDEMTCFVEREIDQMKNRFAGVVGLERCDDELASPPDKEQEHRGPANEC